jgi:hypothetical protein
MIDKQLLPYLYNGKEGAQGQIESNFIIIFQFDEKPISLK